MRCCMYLIVKWYCTVPPSPLNFAVKSGYGTIWLHKARKMQVTHAYHSITLRLLFKPVLFIFFDCKFYFCLDSLIRVRVRTKECNPFQFFVPVSKENIYIYMQLKCIETSQLSSNPSGKIPMANPPPFSNICAPGMPCMQVGHAIITCTRNMHYKCLNHSNSAAWHSLYYYSLMM